MGLVNVEIELRFISSKMKHNLESNPNPLICISRDIFSKWQRSIDFCSKDLEADRKRDAD